MKEDVQKIFLESYDQYAEPLYRYAFFRLFSAARAEELVQETFLKAWEYLSKGKQIEQPRAFLYRLLTNLIIDDTRKKKMLSLEAMGTETEPFDPPDNQHIKMEQVVLCNQLTDAMVDLTEEERTIITLRYVSDLEPKEIAEALGTSADVASVRIHRALKKLKDIVSY